MLDFLTSNSVLVTLAVVLVSIGLKKETLVHALAVCGILNDKNNKTANRRLKEMEDISKDPLATLEIMKDIVDRITEDEEFARNIYANCPRLQALLTKHPDIRPFFESPRFVVISFEKVYRDAVQDVVTAHPHCWVFEILARIHRVVMLPIHIYRFIKACCCATTPDDERICAIINAASQLEAPALQAHLYEALVADPPLLKVFIESNEPLRALRDSNPMCAEMMNDPEIFRIISIPDNLRALGDAPKLIELDFLDPGGEQMDAEVVVDRTTTPITSNTAAPAKENIVDVVVVERTAVQQTRLSERIGFVAGFLGAMAVSWISSVAMRTHVMD